MAKLHNYTTTVRWTGNLGAGTTGYKDYGRNHEISAPGKPVILASSDPAFRGDASRYNPEDLLVASLSTCHMLWYLHLCAVNKVVVIDYEDQAAGIMEVSAEGGGRFLEVTLRPRITVSAASALDTARHLHHEAHEKCYVANSVNFPVGCEPLIRRAD
ncbi:MAG: OsmC family protein [Betaproteobacteria bacterium]|jgi:organic hydroperoxide reductase OsmC/OhrA